MAGKSQPFDLIDTDRYPIHDRSLAAYVAMLETAAASYRIDGICVLPGFLRRDAVELLRQECDTVASLGHRQDAQGTPYLTAPDQKFPVGHPRRAVISARLVAVAYDLMAPGSRLRALYEWDGLTRFVADVVGELALYRYADPLGALNVAVMTDGDRLDWHFDMTDFAVSLAIQQPERGGEFETVRHLRTADDERYDDVAAVLAGEPDRVRAEPFVPGTLMLFAGRNSLHRVTPVEGATARYVALLSYDTSAGANSTDALKLSRYGRLPTPSRRG